MRLCHFKILPTNSPSDALASACVITGPHYQKISMWPINGTPHTKLIAAARADHSRADIHLLVRCIVTTITASLKPYFELAIKNITSKADTDIFPLPFENHVLFDRKESIVPLLCEAFEILI